MKHALHFGIGIWLAFALAAVVSLMLLGSKEKKDSRQELKNESAGAGRLVQDVDQPRSEKDSFQTAVTKANAGSSEASESLYDRASGGFALLFSKLHLTNSLAKDLWLRDAEGRERFITNGVMGAKFSPDGGKIAYSTSSREIVVETVSGDLLAKIPRAADFVWGVDSATVKFTATADPDYPELEQQSIYDLSSGSIVQKKENPAQN